MPLASYAFVHISKGASRLHEKDQRTPQVMTTGGASGVVALAGGRKTPPAQVAEEGADEMAEMPLYNLSCYCRLWWWCVTQECPIKGNSFGIQPQPVPSLLSMIDGTVCSRFLTVCRSRQVIHAL